MLSQKAKQAAKFIVKLGVAGLAVYIVSQKIDFSKTLQYIKHSNIFFLFLALLSFSVSKVISAYRLNLYYKARGILVPALTNIKLYLLGMYYSIFVPGGIGGEGYKVYWLNKYTKTKVKTLIWSSLLDRISGVAALVVLSVISFLFISFEWDYKYLALLLVPIMYVVYRFVIYRFFEPFKEVFWQSNLHSFFVQLLQVFANLFILMALNLQGSYIDYTFIFLVSSLAYAVPVPLVRESVFILFAGVLGLDTDFAAAAGLLFYLNLVIASFSGLYFFAYPKQLKPETVTLAAQTSA